MAHYRILTAKLNNHRRQSNEISLRSRQTDRQWRDTDRPLEYSSLSLLFLSLSLIRVRDRKFLSYLSDFFVWLMSQGEFCVMTRRDSTPRSLVQVSSRLVIGLSFDSTAFAFSCETCPPSRFYLAASVSRSRTSYAHHDSSITTLSQNANCDAIITSRQFVRLVRKRDAGQKRPGHLAIKKIKCRLWKWRSAAIAREVGSN